MVAGVCGEEQLFTSSWQTGSRKGDKKWPKTTFSPRPHLL
jgi:hypothetical protein